MADISYQFRFNTVNNIPSSFLYNDGPITALTPPSPSSPWNRQQTYTLTRVDHNPRNRWGGSTTVLGSGPAQPAVQHRAASTPNYATAGRTRRPLGLQRPVLGHGVRRATSGGLLRRPGRPVRSGRPAALRRRSRGRPGRRPHERHAGRELDRRCQRALPGLASPDQQLTRATPQRPIRPSRRDRGVDHGQPPTGLGWRQRERRATTPSGPDPGPRCRGWAIR